MNLNNSMRIFFMAARTKDLESRTVVREFGANLDLYLKSIRGRHLESADQSKRKYLMLRVGYRALPQIDHTVEHRGVIELSPRYYLPKSIVVIDRNRIDLRGADSFSWRYRNRLSLERDIKVHRIAFTPYGRAEAYYDFTKAKWTRFAYIGGVVFPIGSHLEIEPSYERQINKTGHPDYLNGLGLTTSLYF